MGECGPTATAKMVLTPAAGYSRWGNAGQLQLGIDAVRAREVIADGGMRANCNYQRALP